MTTMSVKAYTFDSANEAIQYANASGRGEAIRVDGKTLVVEQPTADRMEAAGVEFAYLCDYARRDGAFGIVTVPVN